MRTNAYACKMRGPLVNSVQATTWRLLSILTAGEVAGTATTMVATAAKAVMMETNMLAALEEMLENNEDGSAALSSSRSPA
jgi:hypothetical protein